MKSFVLISFTLFTFHISSYFVPFKRCARNFCDMFRSMKLNLKKNDISAYNNILEKCASIGNVKIAEDAFRNMSINEISPNQFSYEYLLLSWMRSKDHLINDQVNEVEIIFKHMLNIGIFPSLVVFCELIKFYGSAQLLMKSESVFYAWSSQLSLETTTTTTTNNIAIYNALLFSYSVHVKVEEEEEDVFEKAEQLFKRILYIGMMPTIETYEFLLICLKKQNRKNNSDYAGFQVKKAIEIFENFRSLQSNIGSKYIKPNIFFYEILFENLEKMVLFNLQNKFEYNLKNIEL